MEICSQFSAANNIFNIIENKAIKKINILIISEVHMVLLMRKLLFPKQTQTHPKNRLDYIVNNHDQWLI